MRGPHDVRGETLPGQLCCVVSEHPHAGGGCARRISLLFSLPRRRRRASYAFVYIAAPPPYRAAIDRERPTFTIRYL